MQTWTDLSEIVFGLLVDGKLSVNAVSPEMLNPPYDGMVRLMKTKTDWGKEDLAGMNFAAFQTAVEAVHSLNGLKNTVNWLDLLKTARVRQEVAEGLHTAYKKLSRNQEIDPTKLASLVSRLTTASTKLQRMSDVQAGDIGMVKTGWKPLDYHIGGLPEMGLITVIGPPKTGKTSWMAKLMIHMLRQYPEKQVVVFTREMLESQFKHLCLQIDPTLTTEEMQRIILCHDVADIHELAALASTIDNMSIIGVDFADLLISGTVDSAAMETIYRVLAMLAIDLRLPIILIAQPANYTGGIPRPFNARWTRLSEALSFMVIALYAPWKDFYAEKDAELLPIVPNRPYMVFWLCRCETKTELPGAIQSNWTKGERWSENRGTWFSLEKKREDKDADDDGDVPSSDWSAYN